MHELNKLSDQALHQKMLVTSQKERDLTAQMISMIEEVARRKYFLDLGFKTLFDYLTEGLRYSSGAAMRRISAARIAREIPEVKERILDGSLSLSNLSQVDQFFRNEQKYSQGLNLENKREVLKQIEKKSTREVEKALVALSSVPEQLKEDKIKILTPELTQITFKANAEFMAHLEEVRGLLAHQMPDSTLSEIMAEAMKIALARLKKKKFKVVEDQEVPVASECLQATEVFVDLTPVSGDGRENASNTAGAGNEHSRYIPASIRREVFRRDQGRCSVVNPRTGKICGSQFKLEIDHFPVPWAMGGHSAVSNLRLACASCNQLHAVQRYGKDQIMSKVNQPGSKKHIQGK